jgi:peptide deformylase
VTKRVIVMDCIKDGPPEPMALVNPEIIWASEDQTVYEEGCLSIPEHLQRCRHHAARRSEVRWTDLDGKQQERQFAGQSGRPASSMRSTIWMASCSSITSARLKRQMITRKMEKLKRERARAV